MSDYITIVLGAGVSKNYGFPLGSELIDLVRNVLPVGKIQHMHDGDFAQIMQSFLGSGVSNLEFVNRARQLRNDMHLPIKSIDTYINKFSTEHESKKQAYREFRFILKAAIALQIAKAESNSTATILADKAQIYAYLFKRLFSGKTSEQLAKYKIINFNYDRSFDHVIRSWLIKEDLDPLDAEIYDRTSTLPGGFKNRFEAIEIIHPYGSIGELDKYKFGHNPDIDELKIMAELINVINHERTTSDEKFETCRGILSNSKEILFLGFGFDPTNMSKLGLTENANEYTQPWFSPFGMLPGEVEDLFSKLTPKDSRPSIIVGIKTYGHLDLVNFLRSSFICLE